MIGRSGAGQADASAASALSAPPSSLRRSAARRAPAALGVGLVYLYRYTLGLLVPVGRCKYHPSCSQYAIDALRKDGLVKGSLRSAWRLLRCNPWSHGGVDHP